MWGYRSFDLPINVFDFTVSRHREGPDEMLRDYTGLLMADCYSGFEGIVLGSDARIVRAACWAHGRRKVFEIRSNHPQPASVLLAMVRELYDIEDRAKEMTADERLALRQRESRPILTRIRDYLDHAVDPRRASQERPGQGDGLSAQALGDAGAIHHGRLDFRSTTTTSNS